MAFAGGRIFQSGLRGQYGTEGATSVSLRAAAGPPPETMLPTLAGVAMLKPQPLDGAAELASMAAPLALGDTLCFATLTGKVVVTKLDGSGRGLGHTGGTLDKLEAIPGLNTRLSLAEANAQVERIGCALIGQTGEIAPADKKLYALRDATATVEASPLIAASIMSKKLAEGLSGLVLDVKTGSGAFMPETDRAIALARTMVGIGDRCGCPTVALLTSMDHPLGISCGNALEIEESIEILRGGGPLDTRELTLALGAEMLMLAKLVPDAGSARVVLEDRLADGSALAKFREIVEAQGGDPRVADEPSSLWT